ncbi:MAG: hypothetical protein OES13_02240 [Acidimicrobiia bacterium]|nr:hypothetical protein [Acidimicrobiia bacterium]
MKRGRHEVEPPPTPTTLDFTMPEGAEVIAVAVDEYLGVTSATSNLFSHTVAPPPDLSQDQLEELVDALMGSGANHFVLSGWSPTRIALADRLAKLGARVDGVWHGNYLQTREDYGWDMFQQLITAARAGTITKVGVVKAGMEVWLDGLGVEAGLLLNYVPKVPQGPSTPEDGGPHVGMWLAAEGYRKLPYAMIAAAGMIPDVTLAGSGVSERALEFAHFVGLDTTRLLRSALSHSDLMVAISRTHLSMYVTQSECGPMLPMESLSLGVPCLIGPTSHVFADDDFLAATLIVPYPEHAEVILRYAINALKKRTEIVEAYREYAPGYIERAQHSVREFLA